MSTAVARGVGGVGGASGVGRAGRLVAAAAPASVTLVAVLAAFGLAAALRAVTGFGLHNVVLAVVLTLTLTRTLRRAVHHPVLLTLEVPVVGLVAGAAGLLIVREPWIGEPLLVLGLSMGIVVRRYGELIRQAGRVVTLPFVALLVTPAASVSPGLHAPATSLATILWAPVIGLLALGCAVAGLAAQRRWLGAPAPTRGAVVPRRPRRRLDAPTRMAIQMAAGVGVAVALGHLLLGEHWPWAAVSAFVVASGNRGRGDVAHKAAMRLVGALGGTVLATASTVHWPAGNRWLLVALFAVLGVGIVLRDRNYAYWAAAVTAMLALQHGYYGDTASAALGERVVGVLLGSTLGLAAAWFVLPVRTSDVLRRRMADCLAALTDELDPQTGPSDSLPVTLHGLDEIAPTLRAHHRTLGRRSDAPHAMDAIAALHRLADSPGDAQSRRSLRRDVVRVRRSMIGKDDMQPGELPPDLAVVHAVLRSTARTR